MDVRLPKHALIVFTGPSGSGKSSLAFDTIYAEGQRRYVESLSSYARQFLGQMEKPKYDHIRGLSPTISIEQKAASNNPRSTVGTITEVYDYLRVLWARIGRQHCHRCGRPVERLSAQEMVDRLLQLEPGTRFLLLARLVENRKGEYRELLRETVAEGFARFRIDGAIVTGDELPTLDKKRKHTIEVVVDRLAVPEQGTLERARVTDSVETALKKGGGRLLLQIVGGEQRLYSEALWCHHCDIGFPELSPQSFSFNSPLGMCPDCNGLGTKPEMDPALVVPDPAKSVREGAIEPWAKVMERSSSWTGSLLNKIAKEFGIDFDKPWRELPQRHRELLLHGSKGKKIALTMKFASGKIEFEREFEGVLNELYRRFRQTRSEGMRKWYVRYLSETRCSTCEGRRLRPESSAVRLGDRSLPALAGSTIAEARAFVAGLALGRRGAQDRRRGGEGDRRAARLPRERRARLPDARPARAVALGRREPAHPAGEPDRQRADRRAVRARRAVDRAPPARQRATARDAPPPARLRQHGDRRRARPRDDRGGRPRGRLRARAPASRAAAWCTPGASPACAARRRPSPARYLSGRLSIPTPRAAAARATAGRSASRARSEHNLKDVDGRVPARDAHRGDRRLRRGQEHARERGALPGAEAHPLRRATTPSAPTGRCAAPGRSTR